MASAGFPVSLGDRRNAARALNGIVAWTPMFENPGSGELLGERLLPREERAQRSGDF